MLANEVMELEQENEKLKRAMNELRRDLNEQDPKPCCCEYCKFYLQHYIKHGNGFHKTYDGHCVMGRIKKRKSDDTCKAFEFGKWGTDN